MPKSFVGGYLLCLPGTEEVLAKTRYLVSFGDLNDAFKECGIALSRAPNIGVYQNARANIAKELGRFSEAYALYLPTYRSGYFNEENFPSFAVTALKLGKLEEAIGALDKSRRIYPEFSETFDNYYCRAMLVYADQIGKASREKEMRLLDQALENPGPGVKRNMGFATLSLLHAEKARLYALSGKMALAAAEKNLATGNYPELRGMDYQELGRFMEREKKVVKKILDLPE